MKQTFKTDAPEHYKGFEINPGKLFNGEEVFEAYHKDLAFYRPTMEACMKAIDHYTPFVGDGLSVDEATKLIDATILKMEGI